MQFVLRVLFFFLCASINIFFNNVDFVNFFKTTNKSTFLFGKNRFFRKFAYTKRCIDFFFCFSGRSIVFLSFHCYIILLCYVILARRQQVAL